MAFQLGDIRMNAELPDISRSMPVFRVKSATLDDRRAAIEFFGEVLELGKLLPVDAQDSLHLINERGEIEFYRHSGALWARNATADQQYPDESRPWRITEKPDRADPDAVQFVLAEGEQEESADRTADLFKRAGLFAPEAYFAGVELDQVGQLDEEGMELKRGAGEANVRFLYKLDGVPVDGGGAKTYAFYNPGEGDPLVTGIFHSWREVQDARTLQMVGIEEALERALVQDKELLSYFDKQYALAVDEVKLVYYTRPPFKFQDYVFPALHVIGSAMPREGDEQVHGFEFARFYNAAPPESYAKAGVYAAYFATRL